MLICAAAIQLTFGLKHDMLNYFRKIYVLKNEYRLGSYTQLLERNLNDEGICFSWSNFAKEYNDYMDGENVGLHEMARALTYVNFTVQDGLDDSFKSKFRAFPPLARSILEKGQAGASILLDKYAATSYEDFWAHMSKHFLIVSSQSGNNCPVVCQPLPATEPGSDNQGQDPAPWGEWSTRRFKYFLK